MLELGSNNYNETMTAANESGHPDIVERMVELGAY